MFAFSIAPVKMCAAGPEQDLKRLILIYIYVIHVPSTALGMVDKLCVLVLVALKYYHDQPTQICVENTFQQPPLRMPKPCRQIGPNSSGDAEEIAHTHAWDQTRFERIMDYLGVDLAERSSVLQLALR